MHIYKIILAVLFLCMGFQTPTSAQEIDTYTFSIDDENIAQFTFVTYGKNTSIHYWDLNTKTSIMGKVVKNDETSSYKVEYGHETKPVEEPGTVKTSWHEKIIRLNIDNDGGCYIETRQQNKTLLYDLSDPSAQPHEPSIGGKSTESQHGKCRKHKSTQTDD